MRVPGKRKGAFTSEVTTWGATANQVLALRDFLLAVDATLVAMEATPTTPALILSASPAWPSACSKTPATPPSYSHRTDLSSSGMVGSPANGSSVAMCVLTKATHSSAFPA